MKPIKGYGIVCDGRLAFSSVKRLKRDTLVYIRSALPNMNVSQFLGYPVKTLAKHHCKLVRVEIKPIGQ